MQSIRLLLGFGIQVLSRKTIIGNLQSKFLIVFSSMREREPEFTKVAGLLHDFNREKFGLLENLKEITFSVKTQVLDMIGEI